MVDTNKYYTIRQFADKKGVSKEAAAKWLKNEKIPLESFENIKLIPKDHPKIKDYNPRPYPKGKKG